MITPFPSPKSCFQFCEFSIDWTRNCPTGVRLSPIRRLLPGFRPTATL